MDIDEILMGSLDEELHEVAASAAEEPDEGTVSIFGRYFQALYDNLKLVVQDPESYLIALRVSNPTFGRILFNLYRSLIRSAEKKEKNDHMKKKKERKYDKQTQIFYTKFLPGSRNWLIERVSKWKCAEVFQSQHFLLLADGGMGKTVLAAKLCHDWEDSKLLLGKIFFKLNQGPPVFALQSLYLQILAKFPCAQKWVATRVKKDGTERDEFEKIVELINYLNLREKITQKWVIVIDGLDEAVNDSTHRDDFLKAFVTFASHLPSNIQLFITSRNDQDIVTLLYDSSLCHRCSIVPTYKEHKEDLKQLIEKKTDILFQRAGWDNYYKRECIDEVYTKCASNILLASMILEPMESNIPWETFRNDVHSLSGKIDDFYLKSFDKILTLMGERGKIFLQLIVASPEPVSEPVVRHFLSLGTSSQQYEWNRALTHVKSLFTIFDGNDLYGKRIQYVSALHHRSLVDWYGNISLHDGERYGSYADAKLYVFLQFCNELCLQVTWFGDIIQSSEVCIDAKNLQHLLFQLIEENKEEYDPISNPIQRFALRQFTHFALECADLRNNWMYIAYAYWTSLSVLQRLFTDVLTTDIVNQIASTVSTIQREYPEKTMIIYDLQIIHWLVRFLTIAKFEQKYWHAIAAQQIVTRLYLVIDHLKQNRQWKASRLPGLYEEALQFVRKYRMLEYISGPVANPLTSLQAIIYVGDSVWCIYSLFSHNYVMSGTVNGSIKIWDNESCTCVKDLIDPTLLTQQTAHSACIQAICVHDIFLFSASDDKTIKLWNWRSAEKESSDCLLEVLPLNTVINSLCILDDKILVGGGNDGILYLWKLDCSTNSHVPTVHLLLTNALERGSIQALSSVSSNSLATGFRNGTVCIWTLPIHSSDNNSLVLQFELSPMASTVNIASPSTNAVTCLQYLCNRHVLACGYENGSIAIWSLLDGTLMKSFQAHQKSTTSLCLLENGRLASSSDDTSIKLWNIDLEQDPPLERELEDGHLDKVTHLSALKNGRLASASMNKSIRIWNVNMKGENLQGHSANINCLCIIPESKVASGSNDNTIRIWNAFTGSYEAELKRNDNSDRQSVRSLCYLQLDELRCYLASGYDDGLICLWDISSQECIRLIHHIHPVVGLSSLTSDKLFSASDDGIILVWKLTDLQTITCTPQILTNAQEKITAVYAIPTNPTNIVIGTSTGNVYLYQWSDRIVDQISFDNIASWHPINYAVIEILQVSDSEIAISTSTNIVYTFSLKHTSRKMNKKECEENKLRRPLYLKDLYYEHFMYFASDISHVVHLQESKLLAFASGKGIVFFRTNEKNKRIRSTTTDEEEESSDSENLGVVVDKRIKLIHQKL